MKQFNKFMVYQTKIVVMFTYENKAYFGLKHNISSYPLKAESDLYQYQNLYESNI